ncbi:nuclear transport factor 2 family protein [Microbacterium sp. A84]|uniref:nuclear transport factor 2 family protein n=1 Tax=Microbacterium sp. A84 TaxID=3450715 RepID=UPI003F41F322
MVEHQPESITHDRIVALEQRLRSVEDHLAIMRLLATYGPAVDAGESKAAADLWTEDGVYDVGSVERVQGHAAIAELYEGAVHQDLIHRGSGHMTLHPQVTVDGDTAVAIAHSLVCRRDQDSFTVWRVSANHWTLRRTSSGWRIVERFNRVLDGSVDSHDVLRSAVRS